MTRRSRWAALAASLLPLAAPALAQQPASLRIHVIDAATRNQIEGAQVGFPELALFTLTNAAGNAVLTAVPAGDRELVVTMLGYGRASATVHLAPGAAATGTVELTLEPIAIEGITVQGRSNYSARLDDRGFYERAKVGLGYHYDELDMESMHAIRIADLIRKHPLGECTGMGFGLSGPGRPESGGPSVFLNGAPIEPIGGRWPFAGGSKGSISTVLLNSFEGVEIYNKPSELPAAFSKVDADCGVILLWTK